LLEDEVSAVRVQLGDAAFEKARAEGCAMTLDEAMDYALENPDSAVIASREAAKQSPSNSEIASGKNRPRNDTMAQ
jgi:hypothetical protein